MSPIGRILNARLAMKSKKMLDRMMAIDPKWAGGHPYSVMGGYYAVLPSIMGGDLKKSSDYYKKAEEAGTGWLYVKFFRAKILHTRTGDREAFRKDLEWVLARDPHKDHSPYPFCVFYQREAKRLLAQAQ
jgi:hypothetical protein